MILTVLKRRLGGLLHSVVRFPVSVAFLAAAAVLTGVAIGSDENLTRFILTMVVGAAAGAAGQAAFERFYNGFLRWIMMMAAVLALTLLFFLSVRDLPENGPELPVRAAVSGFALFIAFVWIAVIRSRYGFGESFMAAFKALFQALFFSSILFLGFSAIIAATDLLITPVNSDAYAHTANIVFIVAAPIMLLSLIPVYPGSALLKTEAPTDEKQVAILEKRTGSPKFLEVLLCYIIIPLSAVFTVILLIYIALNISGRFWTNNLLEPLLISYSAAIIVITLLVGELKNKLAALFRKIFPKVLIPIALFQVIASILTLADEGVTFGRYFVIVYGIFAVCAGVTLSLLPPRKSGAIALALIVLSAVSLIPPVDAFTASRNSQIITMESVLISNGMLAGNEVEPKSTIPDRDKTKVVNAVRYLSDMGELGRVAWLPAGFSAYDDEQFYRVFGFHMYQLSEPGYTYVNVYFTMNRLVPISGYDAFAEMSLPYPDKAGDQTPKSLEIGGRLYSLTTDGTPGTYGIVVKDATGLEIIRFDASRIFTRYAGFPPAKSALTPEEAKFTEENGAAALLIIVRNAGFTTAPGSADQNAQLLVFVRIK